MYKSAFLLFALALVFVSCIKEIDFDQVENIHPNPVVELDLVYFTLHGSDFYDEETQSEILVIRDTTELRFLNDNFMKDGLERVEFFFRFTNSIPRNFDANFSFYSEEDELFYETGFLVDSGEISNPVVTEHTETLQDEAIEQLTQASKVVATILISSSGENLGGSLNLQSKGTYYLTF